MRYLLRYSYLGTKFCGLQRQGKISDEFDKSVQHAIELALLSLKPANESCMTLTTSSRTDKGVHALMNTGHVDLIHRYPGGFYEPGRIVRTVNYHLRRDSHEITMLDAVPVSPDFHARHKAICRSYVYRLAVVIKDRVDMKLTERKYFRVFLPITELNFCHVIGPEFDLEKAKFLCQVLEGKHDFATFKGKQRHNIVKTVREITQLNISPATDRSFGFHGNAQKVTCYNINVESRGFIYKLVRKVVGTIIGYACGVIDLQEVYSMLENPDMKNWNSKLETAPAKGLFLVDVKYSENDLT